METNLGRSTHAARSTKRYRTAAELFIAYLERRAKPDSVDEVFLRAMLIPLGTRALRQVVSLPYACITNEWISFGAGRGKRIVWNVFQGVEPARWREFCKILTSDEAAGNFLSRAIPDFDFGRRGAGISALMDILEAPLCARFPQGLISYANSAHGFASPGSIDLPGAGKSIGQEPRRVREGTRFPEFSARLQLARKLKTDGRQNLAALHASPSADSSRIDAMAVRALQHALKTADDDRMERGYESFLRSAQEIPKLLDAAYGNKKLPTYDAHILEAARLIGRWDKEHGQRVDSALEQCQWRQSNHLIALFGYDAVMRRYGLQAAYPDPNDEPRSALRVILILLSTGRRLGCLGNVRLRDFCDEGEAFDLLITKTKVAAMNNTWLPLDALIYPADLAFLRSWLSVAMARHGDEEFLFRIARIGDPASPDFRQDHADRRFAEQAFNLLDTPRKLRLHDLRRMAITWLAVRLRLCEEPGLAAHPLITRHCGHPLFEKPSLDHLRTNVLGGAGTDHVTILATIAGHKTRYTARQRYNFAFPILTALEAAAVWLKWRSKIGDVTLQERLNGLFGIPHLAPV